MGVESCEREQTSDPSQTAAIDVVRLSRSYVSATREADSRRPQDTVRPETTACARGYAGKSRRQKCTWVLGFGGGLRTTRWERTWMPTFFGFSMFISSLKPESNFIEKGRESRRVLVRIETLRTDAPARPLSALRYRTPFSTPADVHLELISQGQLNESRGWRRLLTPARVCSRPRATLGESPRPGRVAGAPALRSGEA